MMLPENELPLFERPAAATGVKGPPPDIEEKGKYFLTGSS